MQFPLGIKRTSLKLFVALTGLFASFSSFACSNLGGFYDLLEQEPGSVVSTLSSILSDCYDNSEYFALLGAAYLRQGDLLRALENLERALLLDPRNGSAAVDFAEVLYRQGQVLNAIEMNAQLLSREDLPADLKEAIFSRQRLWQSDTNQKAFAFGSSVGYDDNLNSAPIADQLALTLSGNPVLLDVSPQFRAVGGSYARLTAGGSLATAGQNTSTRFTGNITGRFSQDSDYELLQASTRFRINESRDVPGWSAIFGLDHLMWGGNTIFSSATLRASYLLKDYGSCQIYPRLAMQYQFYHAQELLSGYEYSLGVGSECEFALGSSLNRLGFEVSAVNNVAKDDDRLGHDRGGWQANAYWQRTFGSGQAVVQYQHTKLVDEDAYSPLFKNGAKREESLHSVYISYAYPLRSLGESAQFVSTVAYHNQTSSIALFRTRGASAEFGFVWGF